MRLSFAAVLLGALSARSVVRADDPPIVGDIDAPLVGLIGYEIQITAGVGFPAGTYDDSTLVYVEVRDSSDSTLFTGSFAVVADGEFVADYTFTMVPEGGGKKTYTVMMSFEESMTEATAGTNTFDLQQYKDTVTLVPVFITVFIAVVTQNVLMALFAGVYFSSLLIFNFNVVTAFCRTFDYFIVGALANVDHAYIILFSWFLSGMVAGILRSGGGEGLAKKMSRFATTARRGLLVMFSMGLLIFFDDYANTLITGQTMRPIADSVLVSREKLAFLVDSTAAPVASISPISSWIGYEISLIADVMATLAEDGNDVSCYESSPFVIFMKTIPSRYYPFAMLTLQLTLILAGREWGPMLFAERRARTGKVYGDDAVLSQVEVDPLLEPLEETPRRWWNMMIPVAVTIIMVLISLIVTGINGAHDNGEKADVQTIFANSDSFGALLWGGFLGSFTIWFLCWAQQYLPDGKLVGFWVKGARPILGWADSIEVWIIGVRNLMASILILLLAWSIGSAFVTCGTGTFIASALSDNLDPRALPVLAFLISAALALVTGTSWGTMAIMFPLVVPAAYHSAPCDTVIFYGVISSILAGAVFGDHCSPISDTTVLSAMSAKCDLAAHVRTQIPYAFFAAILSMLLGDLPTGYKAYADWAGILVVCPAVAIIACLIGVPVENSTRVDFLNKFLSLFPKKRIIQRRKSDLTTSFGSVAMMKSHEGMVSVAKPEPELAMEEEHKAVGY